MFITAALEDSVAILPQYFGNEEEGVEIELNKKYANKVIHNVGLVVSILSIDKIEDGYVFTGHGSSYATVCIGRSRIGRNSLN